MSTINRQRMIDTSAAFFLAAERCVPELEFGVYGLHHVGAPQEVNYALAVEIALKLLLLETTGSVPKDKKAHNLQYLYKKLPLRVSKIIRDKCPGVRAKGGFYRMLGLNQASLRDRSIFEAWRYPYEHDYLFAFPGDLRRVWIACYRTIRALKPQLKCIYEGNWGSFEPDPQWAWYEMQKAQLDRARA